MASDLSPVDGSPSPDAPRPAPQTSAGLDEATLLAELPCDCFVLDREWRFTYVNARAKRLLGQLAGEPQPALLGRVIWEACPELADSTFAKECRQAQADQAPAEAEVFYPSIGRWFAVHVHPTSGGDRLCVFLQDVTERAELVRELRRRTEELAEADRAKDGFLRQMAHDVRNSLAPVRNALHLVSSCELSEEERRACAIAEQEVRRLSRLLDDLLEVSQVGLDPPRKERVNLAAIVAGALAGLLGSGAGGGRNFTVELPPEPLWLDADPAQLERVVGRLMDNAVKCTSTGGNIRLKAERRGAEVVLRVRDDGIGLAREVLPAAFSQFVPQGHGLGRFQGGLSAGPAVGLTLVSRLVGLHGGSVEAHSDGANRGCEFVVRLPAPPGGAAHAAAEEEQRQQRLRVLVVDDSVEVVQTLALVLGGWGCAVRVAYDGPAALEEVRAHRPDLVLMDLGMPGMDGYAVAERLRQGEGGEQLTLVALTGYSQPEDRERARAAGFDYYMLKPVEPADLKDLLNYVEAGRRQTTVPPGKPPPDAALGG